MSATVLPIASTFTATPIRAAMETALERERIPQDVDFFLYGQMSEFMLRPAQFICGATGAVLMLRIEDFLREDLKSATPSPVLERQARQRAVSRVEEMVDQISALSHGVPQVWVIVCPSNGWIATRHNLRALCRTYSNVLTARIRKLPVTVLDCPPFLLSGECDDPSSDRLGQMPYTQVTFDQLGQFLAGEIKRTLHHNHSVPSPTTSNSTHFASYLASLNVQVKVSPLDGTGRKHVERMLRTIAGFSLTGEKPFLTDDEIGRMLSDGDCLLISVLDRLADYGPSGFVHFCETTQAMIVDAMALSCVVLGKQVEFAVLSALSRYAASHGLLNIVLRYTAAARNQPMQEFLESVAESAPGVGYVLSVSDVETRIWKSAVKPGAWTVVLPSSFDDSGTQRI